MYCSTTLFWLSRQLFWLIGLNCTLKFLTLSYFSFLHFLALSVQIFVLHLNFIVEKNEKLLTGCVNIVIYTLITWKSFKVMRHCSREKGKKPKFMTQLKLNSARQVCLLLNSGQLCRPVLFTPKQVVLYSSKVIMIQASMPSLMMLVTFSRWSPC